MPTYDSEALYRIIQSSELFFLSGHSTSLVFVPLYFGLLEATRGFTLSLPYE